MSTLDKNQVVTVFYNDAQKALDEGKRIAKQHWEEGEFVFKQIPAEIPIEVVPNMTSVPDAVKNEFLRRNRESEGNNFDSIKYDYQLAKVYPDNTIVSFTPSVKDTYSQCWIILD